MTTKHDIAFERTHLERLKLAADVILSEPDDIGTALEAELTLFRDRIEHALLSGALAPAAAGRIGARQPTTAR